MGAHTEKSTHRTSPGFRRGLLFVKALVTVALCALIIWQGDWANIWATLCGANPLLIIVVFAGMLLGVTISTYKWKIILSIHGISFGLNRLQRYYFTSVFFNNFLPSNIGGDVYRIYQTARHRPARAGAVVSVLTERLTGIWALVALAGVGGLLVYAGGYFRPSWLLPVIITFAAIAVLPLIFLTIFQSTASWCMDRSWFPEKLKKVLALSQDYRRSPQKTLQVLAVSFGFHLFTLGWMLVLSHAVGDPSSIAKLALGTAIGNLAALLPVSLNGIGLLDGSFIYVMHALGMNFDAALMMMMLVRAFLIPLSLVGGVFYLQERRAGTLDTLVAHDTDPP